MHAQDIPFNKYSGTQKLDRIMKTTINQPSYFLKEKLSKGPSSFIKL